MNLFDTVLVANAEGSLLSSIAEKLYDHHDDIVTRWIIVG